MNVLFLTLGALISAGVHILADYRGARPLTYIAKPLTTTLILLIAFSAPLPVDGFYQWAIVFGLIFSLAGDIFLMLPSDRFVAGLASFLVTHLCYSVAFVQMVGPPYWTVWVLPIVSFALAVYLLLRPNLGRLHVPVVIYMLAILAMAWLGVTMAQQRGALWAIAAGVGSLLFVVSDATLALNRFRGPLHHAQLLVLSTYYVGQWLIASSVSSM